MTASRAARMAVVLLLSSCGLVGDRADRPGQDAGAPVRGGTLRVVAPDIAVLEDELDPQRSYSGTTWGLSRCCLHRTLYSYNGKSTEEGGAVARPDLAAGQPDVSPDGLTWTFHLRTNLRYAPPFEDTSIISVDLVRALERTARVTSPEIGYPFYYEEIRGFQEYASGAADSIAGLETPDDRTLVVRLDRLTGDLPYRFSLPATAPIPEGAAEGHDDDYARFLATSGPYMIEGSAERDPTLPPEEQQPAPGLTPPVVGEHGVVEEPGSLVLVRNPSWDPATDGLRAAYPDRIELTLGGGDPEEIARRVDTAESDLSYGFVSPFEQVVRYREDPELTKRVFEAPQDLGLALGLNPAVAPFDDVNVRRAVARVIDKAALVEILSRPPHLPIGHTGDVATHVAPDSLEGSLLRAFDPYPHDPGAAREEMRASKYDRNGDGRCDAPECRAVRAVVLDVGVTPEQARSVRDDLAEVGIDLSLEPLPLEEFFGAVHDPAQQVPIHIPYPWIKDFPEGAGWFLGLFDSSGLAGSNTGLLGASPSQLREWGYSVTSVPSVDERLQACLERRGHGRIRCWAELDQYLTTEVVTRIPYIYLDFVQVVSERVTAYSFDQFSGLPALDRIAIDPSAA